MSLDSDDDSKYNFDEFEDVDLKVLRNANNNAVDAINAGALVATGDILIVVSDDFDCPDGWDISVQKEIKPGGVLKTKDGLQSWLVTLPVIHRDFYDRFGYIYFPEYQHMFCDTELTCVAELTGSLINSGLLFKHNHYSISGKKDEVSEKADKTWGQGEKLFLTRFSNNFNLAKDDIKGNITDKRILNWVKNKNR